MILKVTNASFFPSILSSQQSCEGGQAEERQLPQDQSICFTAEGGFELGFLLSQFNGIAISPHWIFECFLGMGRQGSPAGRKILSGTLKLEAETFSTFYAAVVSIYSENFLFTTLIFCFFGVEAALFLSIQGRMVQIEFIYLLHFYREMLCWILSHYRN